MAFGLSENQLQRRNDLIPNLVATVKGFAAHEEQIFTDIANARAKLAGAASIDEKAEAAGELQALSQASGGRGELPDSQGGHTVQGAHGRAYRTENRLSTERMRFNEGVRVYNTMVKQFPMSVFARLTGSARGPTLRSRNRLRECLR